ncbi:MAG: TIM barrel protein [Thermoflexales bacterium]|nr:TIM barrel protein [Thermoflexales bacterium]
MLNELAEAGYSGTELGDWGFMPTDPAKLRAELTGRSLTMTGAFVPVNFRLRERHAEGQALALKTARLIAAVGDPSTPPFLVLADDSPDVPARMANAGRVTPAIGLSDAEWAVYAEGVNAVARAVNRETGLRCVFHHHTGGYIELPDETARLLALTDPAVVGLVLDTGHYSFGTTRPTAQGVLDALERFASRLWYIHFKDCDPAVALRSQAEKWDYHESVKHGIFCELGKGVVPFDKVVQWLRARNYSGFVTVEQDVLPGMGTPRESAARNRAYLRKVGV